MEKITAILISALALCCVQANASVQRSSPQTKPGTYADVHGQQGVGRVLVTPDGKYLLMEWGRPYLNWAPEVKWMAPNAARRLETFLYVVDLTEAKPAAEYLFYPKAAATYWLGDLSPDASKAAVYELSHDNREVRVGVWSFADRKVKWLGSGVDEGRLEGATVWVSGEEFVYPVKGSGSRYAHANVSTGKTTPCTDCSAQMIKDGQKKSSDASASAKQRVTTSATLPKGATLVAGSGKGEVGVYVKDDAEVLSLLYQREGQPVQVLFENARRWSPAAPAGATEKESAR